MSIANLVSLNHVDNPQYRDKMRCLSVANLVDTSTQRLDKKRCLSIASLVDTSFQRLGNKSCLSVANLAPNAWTTRAV